MGKGPSDAIARPSTTLTPAQAAEVAPLARGLIQRAREGLPCLMALSVPPLLQGAALAHLRSSLNAADLSLTELEVPDPPPASLPDWLLAQLRPGAPAALRLLHRALPEGAHALNLMRDRLRDARVSLVLLLTPGEMAEIANDAPDLWRYLHGFGAIRQDAGESDALSLWRSSQGEERWSAKHPPTKSALERLWRDWERLRAGEVLEEQALEGAQALFEGLRSQGDVGGMRRFSEELAESLERSSPYVRFGLELVLALQWLTLGNAQKAEALLEHSIERQRAVSVDGPNLAIAAAQSLLAWALMVPGDLATAGELQKTALGVFSELLGPDHPRTHRQRSNLARLLLEEGDLDGARVLQEAVLQARVRLLGEAHPDTLNIRHNLGLTLATLGDWESSLQHLETTWATRARLLGAEHPDTLTTRSALAEVLQQQGALTSAREHREAVWAARIRVLGAEHPATLTSRLDLARTLIVQGEFQAARAHSEAVWAARARFLGRRHDETTFSAWFLYEASRLLQAPEAGTFLREELSWLLEAEDDDLSAAQKRIRERVAEDLANPNTPNQSP